jgi:phosphatidylserine/phosphatidylglycerophosphate/cardiolipin synthase-like enzyme
MMNKLLMILVVLALPFGAAAEEKKETTGIVVCEHGLEMFSYALEFVRNANYSIEFSTPFFGGKILRELIETIDKRMEEVPALQVHILTAPMLLEDRDEKMLKVISAKYPERFHLVMSTQVPRTSPDLTSIHNHVKVFLVDEHYFAVGGTNLDEGLCCDGSYTPPRKPKDKIGAVKLPAGARDGDVVGRGILAKELRVHFFNLYALWEDYQKTVNLKADPGYFKERSRYFSVGETKPFVTKFEHSPSLVEVEKIKSILSGAWQAKNGCTQEYIRLLNEAKKKVIIGNMYFCPADSLLAALKGAVNRGLEMRFILNGVHKGVTPDYNANFCWANRLHHVPMFYGRDFRLWEAGMASRMAKKKCTIYEYYVRDVVYHKKAMVVDDAILVIGSYNLGRKSDIGDYELILVIESEKVCQHALEIFEREIALSIEITPGQARKWYFDPVTSAIAGSQKLIHGIL